MMRHFAIFHRNDLHGSAPGPVSRRPQANGSAHPRDGRADVDDQIARLVQSVFLLPGAARVPQAVAFCGIDAGVGCSWVCARAAEVLAEQVPGRVCIVDANLRSASLHGHFRVERNAGFSDAMKDGRPIREFARPVRSGDLWLLTAGAVKTEPNGALNPARLRARFSELRAEFDWLLLDTPAMSRYADAVLLGQLTDGVILVVGSNSTRRETARSAKRSFEAAGVPMLGAVLNKRTFPIPQALYQRL